MRRGAIGAVLGALVLSTLASCSLPKASSNGLGFFVGSQSPGDVTPWPTSSASPFEGISGYTSQASWAAIGAYQPPATSLRLYLSVSHVAHGLGAGADPRQPRRVPATGARASWLRARPTPSSAWGGSGPRPTSPGGCRTRRPPSTSRPSTTSSPPCAASPGSTSSSTGARPPTRPRPTARTRRRTPATSTSTTSARTSTTTPARAGRPHSTPSAASRTPSTSPRPTASS